MKCSEQASPWSGLVLAIGTGGREWRITANQYSFFLEVLKYSGIR
jgi:hypothetical protein